MALERAKIRSGAVGTRVVIARIIMELQNVVVRAEAEIMELEDRIITAIKQRDRARAEALSKQRARLRLQLAARRATFS